jgi:predicted metal-dependent phosphoesterase TrpH
MKIDFHVHTNRSVDAIPSPREVVKAAKQKGLDGIAITDHNRFFPKPDAQSLSREFGILVIPGIEGGQIAVQKHWIAAGIGRLARHDHIDRILESIREQGGLSIAPHPHTRLGYADYASRCFDAVESMNGSEPEANLLVTNPTHVPEVGGSDAHSLPMLGHTWTEVDADATTESVLESVRKGRCSSAGSAIPRCDLIGFYPQYVMRRILREPRAAMRHALSVIQEVRAIRAHEACHSVAECIHPGGDQIS